MEEDLLDEHSPLPGDHLPKSDFCLKCGAPTCFKKLYCPACVFEAPYVRGLAAELDRRKREETNAHKKFARIDLNGSRCREIVDLITYRGALTLSRIAAELDIRMDALKGYLRRLEKAGMLSTGSLLTRRKASIRVVLASPKKKRRSGR